MAFINKLQPFYSTLSLLAILQLLFLLSYEATASGLTTNLIHRDSPISPFYNPSKTHFDRLHDSFERSLKRINHFKSAIAKASSIQSPLLPGSGEYLMKLAIGTPPVAFIAIIDTGSDLIWTQCLPCIECYKQKLPVFDPHRSSTYHNISCLSSFCDVQSGHEICGSGQICDYQRIYGDGSYTNGNLAFETLTLGSRELVPLPNIVFGCGIKNGGGTFEASASGLIGLGSGKFSLVSQLGPFGRKFSYCLVPTVTGTSKISFGSDVATFGSGVISTPLVTKDTDTFYHLTLEAFSVGDKRITYKGSSKKASSGDVEGNIIIDTGTKLTFLPSNIFEDLVSTVEKAISAKSVDPPSNHFSLCYNSSSNINFPIITAHFEGGDVQLQPLNTFIKVKGDVVCLAMTSSDELPIFGNLAQKNFLIGYDLEARTISFKPTDCTKPN